MNRTGTTSLRSAIKNFGYKTFGGLYPKSSNSNQSYKIQTVKQGIEKIQFYGNGFYWDDPWFMIYKELDMLYPKSKFILTWRSVESWIKSCTAYFGKREEPAFVWYYGASSVLGNEEIWMKSYKIHSTDVMNYFKDRPKDLLVLNICDGEGYDKIASFLGSSEKIDKKFPHRNRGIYNINNPELLQNQIRNNHD